MNQVNLIGRITKDPDVRYTSSQMAVARFSLAINRPKDKEGNTQADYPGCIAFGKTAEHIEKYVTKGMLLGVTGRIQTGSYKDKEGKTVYTTDVIADRVEFLDRGKSEQPTHSEKPAADDTYSGFSQISNDDIPF